MSFSQEQKKAKGSFIIQNDKGLHTRPCTEIVRCSLNFGSEIQLQVDDNKVDAKSVLSLLTLAAEKGTQVSIEAEGDDATEAVEALLKLAEKNFHISF